MTLILPDNPNNHDHDYHDDVDLTQVDLAGKPSCRCRRRGRWSATLCFSLWLPGIQDGHDLYDVKQNSCFSWWHFDLNHVDCDLISLWWCQLSWWLYCVMILMVIAMMMMMICKMSPAINCLQCRLVGKTNSAWKRGSRWDFSEDYNDDDQDHGDNDQDDQDDGKTRPGLIWYQVHGLLPCAGKPI